MGTMVGKRMTSRLRGFGCRDRELQPQIGLLVWSRLCGAQAQAGVVSATIVRHTGSSARSIARKLHPGGQTASTFRPQEGVARGDGGHSQLRHLSSPVSIYIPSTTPTRHCQQQMMLRLPHLCPAIPLLPWFVLCARTPLPLAILAHGRRLTFTRAAAQHAPRRRRQPGLLRTAVPGESRPLCPAVHSDGMQLRQGTWSGSRPPRPEQA